MKRKRPKSELPPLPEPLKASIERRRRGGAPRSDHFTLDRAAELYGVSKYTLSKQATRGREIGDPFPMHNPILLAAWQMRNIPRGVTPWVKALIAEHYPPEVFDQIIAGSKMRHISDEAIAAMEHPQFILDAVGPEIRNRLPAGRVNVIRRGVTPDRVIPPPADDDDDESPAPVHIPKGGALPAVPEPASDSYSAEIIDDLLTIRKMLEDSRKVYEESQNPLAKDIAQKSFAKMFDSYVKNLTVARKNGEWETAIWAEVRQSVAGIVAQMRRRFINEMRTLRQDIAMQAGASPEKWDEYIAELENAVFSSFRELLAEPSSPES